MFIKWNANILLALDDWDVREQVSTSAIFANPNIFWGYEGSLYVQDTSNAPYGHMALLSFMTAGKLADDPLP